MFIYSYSALQPSAVNVSEPVTHLPMSGAKQHIKTTLPNNFLTSQDMQQLIDQIILKLEHECELCNLL